ncbi:pikachurin-like [Acropora palmata]|uniref:pikachurin-like n=1 Tax=Acropora palmata TaxID=6131 RepID=UPI003DA075C7
MRYGALSQMKIEGGIQMDIRPISRSGILLSNKGKGKRFDFIFLVLIRGWVIFGYDLGKGSATIKSNVRIKINEWNNIRAYRKGINGYLEVNGKRVVGSSPAGLSQLNLDDYMYLGGVQSVPAKYAKILKTKAGFFGSVANLVISGVRYGLVFPGWFTVAAVNVVMNSNKDLCMMKPCYYGGTCRVIENEVKCICPRGFLGDRCEIRANVPYFQGGVIGSASYIQLEPMVLRTDEFAVVLEVRPEHHTGLIMYSELGPDFISLAMLAGKLELRFNLGKGRVVISSDSSLGLNQWHHVEIIRVGLEGMLIVDYGKAQTGIAPGKWLSLNLEGANMYLGGGVSRNRARILRDTGVEVGFQGCIRELETEDEDLRERPLDLMISDGNNRATSRVFHRVKKCGCVDHGCQNEGTCMQRDHDFRCECKNGYTGYQCHIKGCSKDFVFDVGFAIDGSGSIDNNEYKLTKDFVLDIIGIFSVSDEGTHIALLEYASEAPIKIYFDDNFDLLNEVKGLKQSKGHTTNIGTGLKQSLAMFDVNNGMRQEVEKLFVFFTDGINTDRDEDLTQYTRQIKSKGITTISVGVGNDTDINELTTIAGSRENVIRLGEFEELKLIVEKLIPKECKDGE